MGLRAPVPYTFVPVIEARSRLFASDPLVVLRRDGPRFFGKTSKLSLTVTLHRLPKQPMFRTSSGQVIATVAIWAGTGMVGIAQTPSTPPVSVYGRVSRAAATEDAAEKTVADASAGQAERIVAATLAGLGRAESIAARVRQRVRVGDHVLVGAGRYIQLGTGADQRFRYELSMQCDTEQFDVLEVCDGVFHWAYRRLGPNTPQLERLDVGRVRDKLEQLKVLERNGVAPYLGGLQRSLALLREWFRFTTVDSASIDEVPVWRVEGEWNPAKLAKILRKNAQEIRDAGGLPPMAIPDGMPARIRLSIGKRELFPFRVEWLAIPGPRPVAESPLEPIAVLELYDVRIGEPVDAAAFIYKPALEGLIDVTDGYLAKLAPLRR